MASLADDETAIIQLIHRNRIAIWMRDYEAWASCFVHAPYTARWGWWAQGGVFARRGWEDISVRLRHDLTVHPDPHPSLAYDTKVVNLCLRIAGDTAWATFEQHYPGLAVSEKLGRPGIAHEMRVFERHDGEWKIAFLGLLDGGQPAPVGVLRLRLDHDGRVLSGAEELAAVLADDDLALCGGRLRTATAESTAACRPPSAGRQGSMPATCHRMGQFRSSWKAQKVCRPRSGGSPPPAATSTLR